MAKKTIREGDFIKCAGRYYLVLQRTPKPLPLVEANTKFKSQKYVAAVVLKKMVIVNTKYMFDWDIFDIRRVEILNDHKRKGEFLEALLKISINK